MLFVPHDLTDEQLNELSALVTLFDVELSETLEAILLDWAAETGFAEEVATYSRGSGSTDELNDLAARLRSARGDEPVPHQQTRGRRRFA
jgi:hypothetical protein